MARPPATSSLLVPSAVSCRRTQPPPVPPPWLPQLACLSRRLGRLAWLRSGAFSRWPAATAAPGPSSSPALDFRLAAPVVGPVMTSPGTAPSVNSSGRVIIIDPSGTYYLGPLLQFQEAKYLGPFVDTGAPVGVVEMKSRQFVMRTIQLKYSSSVHRTLDRTLLVTRIVGGGSGRQIRQAKFEVI